MMKVLVMMTMLLSIKNTPLYFYVKEHDCLSFKETTLKIFLLETANLKSKLFLKHNNVAGIKFNNKGFCSGKVNSYAKYECWENSIEDFCRIQQKVLKKYNPKTEHQYLIALQKYGYFKDLNYIKKIKHIKI